MFRFVSAVLICGLHLFANSVFAGSLLVTEDKLTASDAAANDWFGDVVAISGDRLVVGARLDDDKGTNSGSAYVFVRSGDTWTEEDKLTAIDGAADDNFGSSVAIDGDTVVVGAFGDDDKGDDSGSVYVFERLGSAWAFKQKIVVVEGAAGDVFGGNVTISGDTLVASARLNDDTGPNSGSVYVFVRSGGIWSLQQKLTASDAAAGDLFGASVAVDGDTLVVGANGNDDEGSSSGSAYVFVRSGTTWSEQAKLTANDAALGDQFGNSVALSGDTVAVGAFRSDDAGFFSGSAYVFVRSGSSWKQQTKLTANDAAEGDEFGGSVALSGDTVVVGSRDDDDAGTNSGSAYVFVRSGTKWTLLKKLTASDAGAVDNFGGAVALSGKTVVVGARLWDGLSSNTNSGAVYALKLLFQFQGKVTGTGFCELTTPGTGKKTKLKDPASITIDTSRFPEITADLIIPGITNSIPLTGVALHKNPKSGVFQLFGDNIDNEAALSGTFKVNKKTGIWTVLSGKIQMKDLGGDLCTFAGKFKLK